MPRSFNASSGSKATQFFFRIPKELRLKLKMICAKRDIFIANFIRESLEEILKKDISFKRPFKRWTSEEIRPLPFMLDHILRRRLKLYCDKKRIQISYLVRLAIEEQCLKYEKMFTE